MRGGLNSCGSLHEQPAMRLCALTAATYATGILGLSYSESLMIEYSALADGVGLDAAIRL